MNLPIRKFATMAAVALALPVVAMAPATQAATMITQWDYDVDTAFSGYTPDPGTFGGVVGTNAVVDVTGDATPEPSTLQWSDDDGDTSSIGVTAEVDGTDLFTNSVAVSGATFFHDNQAIDSNATTLNTASILSQLILTPLAPVAGAALAPQTINFEVNFEETPNSGDLLDCPGNAGSICDDIFVLTDPDGSLTEMFTLDGYKYTVLLDILGLGPLDADACTAAGVAPGCRGLLTEEGKRNPFGTEFSISAVKVVPEPSTLSILAMGLLCLVLAGYSRNRRSV